MTCRTAVPFDGSPQGGGGETGNAISSVRPSYPRARARPSDPTRHGDFAETAPDPGNGGALASQAVGDAAPDDLGGALRALASGDASALGRIWALCADDLYGLALWRTGCSADAEDAVQDVFVRIARSPGVVALARDPKAYLLTMVRRSAVDLFRRRREVRGVTAPNLLVASNDPGRAADAVRASGLAAQLPPALREVVYLKHFGELTFVQIARVTGVPTFTAASRYRLALGRLRKQMGVF